MAFPARAAPLAFTAIALLASGIARAADPVAQHLLWRMSASLRSVDYEGSFIYQQDGRTDALRIFHLGGDRERERLVSLTGARNEIVRDDRTITCIQTGLAPTQFSLRNGTGLLPLTPNVRELGAEYAVALAGADRVAGYDASIVDIVPRDPYRYGYRLWLSRDNQLLLRSAIVDAKRQPLAQFMFVALDVGTKPSEADLAPAETLANAVTADANNAAGVRPGWRVEAPAGFRLVRTERVAGNASQSEQLVYTDGVASVSIYVEPHADAKQSEGATASAESTIVRGALSIHSQDAGGLRVTALGDVPPATVQAMAKSVRAIASAD
jgi:sigma-E factor negative regulatory protein RseB